MDVLSVVNIVYYVFNLQDMSVVTQAYYKLSFLLFTWNEQSYYCRR